MKVYVLLPDLSLPWGQQPKDLVKARAKLNESPVAEIQKNVRRYWKTFAETVVTAFQQQGHQAELTIHPMWEITSDLVDSLDADLVFVGHRCHLDFPATRVPVLFYMQIIYPWLFTVDPKGWSAACTHYPVDMDRLDENESENGDFFDYYSNWVRQNQLTKFNQKKRQSQPSLILKKQIPFGQFIFFPCQIPHDRSIQFFSPLEEIEVMKELAEWSKTNKVPVVFKGHPVNPKSMKPLLEAVPRGKTIYWSDANIHDLIFHSAAVYTINSGVGFEALFYKKPVITFGNIEYDCVTFKADLDHLDSAWEYTQAFDFRSMKKEYARFVRWFCREHAVDLEQGAFLENRLSRLVRLGEETVSQSLSMR